MLYKKPQNYFSLLRICTYLPRIHKQTIQFSNCEFHSHKHKVAFSYQRQFPGNWQEYIITHCFICTSVHKVFYQWEPTYCEGEVFFPRLMRLISFFLFIYSNPFIRWLRKCVFVDVKEHSVGAHTSSLRGLCVLGINKPKIWISSHCLQLFHC